MIPESSVRMLNLIHDNPLSTRNELAELYGAKLQSASIARTLSYLRNKGLVETTRVPEAQFIRFRVTDKGIELKGLIDRLEAILC